MATAGPFYDTMPGPERRDALNQMWATWQAALENAAGEKGWSPLLRAAVDGDRLVMELHDWTGGEGDKPTQRGYLGAAGYVPGIADALDFRGPRGLQGLQGDKGEQGDIGPKGDQGLQGLKGDKGDAGDRGDQGPEGLTGATGPAGQSFDPDAVGPFAERADYDAEPLGFAFLATDQGLIYFRVAVGGWSVGMPFGKGEKGDKGDQGDRGADGATGADGPEGPAGVDGIQGPQGDTGAKGDKGDKGGKGDTGATGATGAPGATTIPGIDGLQAALDNKVDKVAGKGLSTNDYTTAEKTKLSGIAAGATANATNAQLRDRATHTGVQAIATVTGLQAALDGKLGDASSDGKQYARKNGAWTEVLTSNAVGYQEFTSSQTWPKPAGANCFYVEVLSGGGSGAATFGNSSWTNAEGGAGGVLRRTVMLASALGSSIGIIVGSGGAAVSANSPANTVGNAGGDSSFDSFVSPGGLGGKANSTSPNVPLSWSGITIAAMSFENYASGGNAAVGGSSFDGGGGGGGAGSGSNPTPAGGTSKTAGAGGAGARGGASGANAAGSAGSAPGGGGGAAAVYGGLAVATSGAGAAGRVRVWWW